MILGEIEVSDDTEAFEGEVRADEVYLGEAGGNEGGVAAGGDDMETAAGAELEANLGEDLADEATVAVNGAGKHGRACGFADGGGGLGGADMREERGALEKVIGHGAEAGGDDAANVAAVRGDDVEGDSSAEIDNNGGGAIEAEDGGGVGEAICADGGGAGVFDAGAEVDPGADGEEMAAGSLGSEGAEGEAGFGRDDAGEDDFLTRAGHFFKSGAIEVGGGNAGDAAKRVAGGRGELGKGVADVDEQVLGGRLGNGSGTAGHSEGLSVVPVCVGCSSMPHNPQVHPTAPLHRPRRLRSTSAIRDLVRENVLQECDLILPLFVSEKITKPLAVPSMPGVWQQTLAGVRREAEKAFAKGVRSVLLFGIPKKKDDRASQAYAENGIVQQAVRALKKDLPELVVITDVCLCEYMSHGHCGIVHHEGGHAHILNDESLELLAATALSHAQAGADIVAPSDMMDGRVRAIRERLDGAGRHGTIIMSYAAKFCSAYYGPFRDAAESAPAFGDRRTYQMDYANGAEALREVELDIAEGADIVMIKPGLPYLDIVWRVKEKFGMPTVVYNVSGEYAMVKAAAAKGWLDERSVVMETMMAFKRAGADLVITYWAREVLEWLQKG